MKLSQAEHINVMCLLNVLHTVLRDNTLITILKFLLFCQHIIRTINADLPFHILIQEAKQLMYISTLVFHK